MLFIRVYDLNHLLIPQCCSNSRSRGASMTLVDTARRLHKKCNPAIMGHGKCIASKNWERHVFLSVIKFGGRISSPNTSGVIYNMDVASILRYLLIKTQGVKLLAPG